MRIRQAGGNAADPQAAGMKAASGEWIGYMAGAARGRGEPELRFGRTAIIRATPDCFWLIRISVLPQRLPGFTAARTLHPLEPSLQLLGLQM
jgi:hypothetical protein